MTAGLLSSSSIQEYAVWGLLLPVAFFDDGGVALDVDGIGGFGRHGDAVVGMLTGT